jgi:hypothetical protein
MYEAPIVIGMELSLRTVFNSSYICFEFRYYIQYAYPNGIAGIQMQIICASCKSVYNLTTEQVSGLAHSILPCVKCNRFIKITICPYCYSYYSITFTSTRQEKYQLACEQCGKPFVIDFPLIKEGKDTGPGGREKKPIGKIFSIFKSPSEKTEKKFLLSRDKLANSHLDAFRSRDGEPAIRSVIFTLGNLFSICGSAFTIRKISVASIAVIISLIMLMGYNRATDLFLTPVDFPSGDFIKSLLTILPFAIIIFMYMTAATVIAGITMNAVSPGPGSSGRRAPAFMARIFPPLFLTNVLLLVVVDLILILFGNIPIVGPILFAIMFLPIYITSLCIMVLLAIGIWFYPPIIASSEAGTISSIRSFLRFIRRQNFNLAYTIPLMTILTALTFAAVYLLHYGSFNLSMYLAKNILTDDGEKLFSAIPHFLIQISDLAIIGSDTGLYRTLADNLLPTHAIGGGIIGIIFSLISILLFASFISISSTLSTHLYLMMKEGTDMDDASKLRILILLVLILLGIFLVKKILA